MRSLGYCLFATIMFVLLISIASCTLDAIRPTTTIAPAAVSTATPAPTFQPSDSERKLTINSMERSYLLHIPPGLDVTQPAPLVLAFHGAGDNPDAMQRLTGLNEIADKSGFLLVYPVGIGQTWNAGGKCCGEALTKNTDDIAFVRQILSDLETIVRVDNKRIYATGFSNGGALVDRLACEMPDVFAAVASVAGILAYSPCEPQQPISVMHVHGLADPILPYKGGGSFEIRSVEEIMATWAELNGCTDSPSVDNPINTITHTAYTSCQAGTTVELYAVEGGSHAWIPKNVYPLSEVIWNFFVAHPKS